MNIFRWKIPAMRTSFLLTLFLLAQSLFAQDPPRIWSMILSEVPNNKGMVSSVTVHGEDPASDFNFDDAIGWDHTHHRPALEVSASDPSVRDVLAPGPGSEGGIDAYRVSGRTPSF